MHLKALLSLTFVLFSTGLFGQAPVTDQEDHDHVHHHHHRNEIGIANSAVYFVGENVYSYGLHIHYLYNLKETRFSLGAGYERIFDDHRHQTIGLLFGYRPAERLNLNLSPGLAFEGSESAFALHLELSYEYEIGDIHLGPAIELALEKEDYHFSLGIHVGFGF